VGCAGSSEHGPHHLREGHMGDGGGGCQLVWCSTVRDSVGRMKVGGNWKVGLELKKLNLSVQQSQHVM